MKWFRAFFLLFEPLLDNFMTKGSLYIKKVYQHAYLANEYLHIELHKLV